MDNKAYNVSNQSGVGIIIHIDHDVCIGCNTCVEVCRQHIYLPNPERGGHPNVLNPEECWFDGCCVLHCPVPGALKVIHPLMQRVGWKRKDTGEYFRIGMKNPPSPNIRPPVGWDTKDTLPYASGRDAITIFS